MSTVKTAISIDSEIFGQVERLSKKLHISRSQFFSQAARHLVTRDENLDLLKRINAAFEPESQSAGRLKEEKSYTRRKVIERW